MQKFVKRSLCATLLLVYIFSAVGHAREREPQRGKILLERMCGRCHAVGTTGRSPHGAAPPFRTFSDETLYDENFAQRLHKGLLTGHRDMPTFDSIGMMLRTLSSISVHSRAQEVQVSPAAENVYCSGRADLTREVRA